MIGNDLRGLNLQAGVPQDLVGDGDDGVAALDLSRIFASDWESDGSGVGSAK